ncbi:hypothetical protein [Microvirga sp. M2]|uniref:hypothetical protein n=1 Tax=Microvirga sp. M2 TaxID=3073270 RepID=UPI0039C0F9D2
MGLSRKSFVTPVLHTMPDDFGLSHPEVSQNYVKRLLSAPYKVLQEDGSALLGDILYGNLGEIFLFKRDEAALTYYLRYEVKLIEPLGVAATQVALWRRCASGLEGGTSNVIYTLLNQYNAIVSTPSLTPSGQRFWIDRMAESHVRGLVIGLMDGDILLPYDGARPLLEWGQSLDGRESKDGSEGRCFYISKQVG